MGFRFRRSIRILPGIRLNFGKRGVSTSIGVRGARVTVGHCQVRETVGLPGTGLSYTYVEKAHQTAAGAQGEAQPPTVTDVLPKGRAWRGWLWIALLAAGTCLALAHWASAKEPGVIIGAGSSRCSTYHNYNHDPHFEMATGIVFSWVQGYISGRNVEPGVEKARNVGGSLSVETLRGFLDTECADHPDEYIVIAASHLYDMFAAKGL